MVDFEQNSVNLTFVGAVPIRDAVRQRLFAALAAHDLAPTGFGWGDEAPRPFDPNDPMLRDRRETFWLSRDVAPAYRMVIYGWPTPTVWLRAPAPVDAATLSRFADVSDQWAAITTPDIAWLSNRLVPRTDDESDDARTQLAMNHSSSGQPQWYRERGPGGLALRTYLGPFLLDQIGRGLVATLPSPTIVTNLDRGGVRVDLVGESWDATPDVVLAAWRRARAHLERAQFFTRVEIGPRQAVRFVRPDNPNRDPGGRAR